MNFVTAIGATGIRPAVRRIAVVAASVLGLNACAATQFQAPQAALDEPGYASIYPYFAEYCAVSELRKNKGTPVDIEGGGPGGHSLFYLNGVCRVHDAGYPELALCDGPVDRMAGRGVGLSVNEHFKNANWIATEGRDFFYAGDLAPGEGVTRASYARTQAKAEAMGILDGVVFHPALLEARPAGMTEREYMYEISIATDYAIGFGRDRYCARVPLDRARMASVVRYLNDLNRPYRSKKKPFIWNVLRNNCAYLAHNALAAAGLWKIWRTDRPLLIAAFDFPVPKNEFVNLMRRTNEMPIADANALYADREDRSILLHQDWIPTQPGALAQARPAAQPNDLYDTHVRLIFYDEVIFGAYQRWFDRIFSEPRYTDLTANLGYFSTLYAAILASRPPQEPSDERGAFGRRYDDIIAREKRSLDAARASLSGATLSGAKSSGQNG